MSVRRPYRQTSSTQASTSRSSSYTQGSETNNNNNSIEIKSEPMTVKDSLGNQSSSNSSQSTPEFSDTISKWESYEDLNNKEPTTSLSSRYSKYTPSLVNTPIICNLIYASILMGLVSIFLSLLYVVLIILYFVIMSAYDLYDNLFCYFLHPPRLS